jgi:hypothetical protein
MAPTSPCFLLATQQERTILTSHPGKSRNAASSWAGFFLPALKALQMWLRSPYLAADIGEGTRSRPSNLERLYELSLMQARLNIEDINALLPQMRSIKYLSLSFPCKTCLEQLQNTARLELGLKSHSGTLKSLYINPFCTSISTGAADVYAGNQARLKLSHGLFKSFGRLTFISLPIPLLLS